MTKIGIISKTFSFKRPQNGYIRTQKCDFVTIVISQEENIESLVFKVDGFQNIKTWNILCGHHIENVQNTVIDKPKWTIYLMHILISNIFRGEKNRQRQKLNTCYCNYFILMPSWHMYGHKSHIESQKELQTFAFLSDFPPLWFTSHWTKSR